MKLSKQRNFFLCASILFICPIFAKGNEDPHETNRVPQFETDDVKVWKTIITPKQPLTMHNHDSKRVVVALTDTDLRVIDDKGKTLFYHWPKGTAHLLEADKPGELHADINETDHAMEIMVIQLKK